MLISAFVFGGTTKSALKKAFTEGEIWISPSLLEEYRDTPFELKAAGKITAEQMKALISGIVAFVAKAKVVAPGKKLSLCRDEEDNMVLECCLSAKADYVITGDKDLLEIEKSVLETMIPKLSILSPRSFLAK